MPLPAQSLAAVVEEFGAPVTITEVPVPQELEPGALLVRVEAATICGTDVHLWQGELSLRVDLPVILGHEMVGRVVALGAGAGKDSVDADLAVGDRVVWSHASCGHCRHCTVGQPALCPNRRSYMYESCATYPYLLGGFSQYAYVLPAAGRVRVPDGVSDRQASVASCALRSVVNALGQVGRLSSTDTVVVQGTGPLGLLATGMCHIAGARVIAIGAPADRLDLAADFGADEVLSIQETTAAERAERVAAATGGAGADVVLEFSGSPHAFREGLDLVAAGGRYMVVGQLGQGEVSIPPALITKKNLQVLGSFSGAIQHYWQALRFLERHQHTLPFDRLVTGTFPLRDATTALTRMQREEEIKAMLLPG